MVAIVAHVFGVVLSISVRTLEDFSAFPLARNFQNLVIFFVGVNVGFSSLSWGVLVENSWELSNNTVVFFLISDGIIRLRNLGLLVNVPRLGVINAFLPHASLIFLIYLVKLEENVLDVEVLFTLSHGGLLFFLDRNHFYLVFWLHHLLNKNLSESTWVALWANVSTFLAKMVFFRTVLFLTIFLQFLDEKECLKHSLFVLSFL